MNIGTLIGHKNSHPWIFMSNLEMHWVPFHHPDISLPVIRRRLNNELIDLLSDIGRGNFLRTWTGSWNASYPSRTAYDKAMYRLRRDGLIAYQREGGKDPVLVLTEEGEARRSPSLRPTRFWNQRWNGIWYVLVYDVPETNRSYRDNLRRFLGKKRMGCLQASVWVTPFDFRPEYSDLAEASGLGGYAFLFEARTVLGQSPTDVVLEAWDFERIDEAGGRTYR